MVIEQEDRIKLNKILSRGRLLAEHLDYLKEMYKKYINSDLSIFCFTCSTGIRAFVQRCQQHLK